MYNFSFGWMGYFLIIYSNKKEMSDFHGTVSSDPVKQQKATKMLIKHPTHKKNGIFLIYLLLLKGYKTLCAHSFFLIIRKFIIKMWHILR